VNRGASSGTRIAPPIGAREGSTCGDAVKPRPRGLGAAGLALALLAAAAMARGEALRVGTSGDYPPFSLEAPGAPDGLDGLDLELLRRFAKERGHTLRFVRFRWPDLARAFGAGEFDLAVGGITVRPERAVLGIFTRPVVLTGAVALVRDAARFPGSSALARARIAVNAGGHLERVARALFPAAQIVAVADNGAPPRLLAAGEVDAALTDAAEAPVWRRSVPEATQLGPFTRDAKAFWVRLEREALARDLDGWLAAREADGSLARLRAERLGAADSPAAAAPLPALVAAVRERLELAPLVAEAKRTRGLPVAAPAQEQRVLEAALGDVRGAAARAGRAPPPDADVRACFAAQIEAGKALQTSTLAGPASSAPPFDLDAELRPALARVGARIAALVVELPPGTLPEEIQRAASESLALPGLPDAERARLADSLARLAPPR
jgi:cyclohexadienyl dehydratase